MNFAPELLNLEAELRRREQTAQEAQTAEEQTIAAELGRRSLADFIRAAWPQVEPGRALVWGWHLDAIAEHLEAVSAGQIQNLAICIPPGCTKSRAVGVFWPAWTWLRKPETRWLFFSNSDDLATRESLACRRLLESEWYLTHYPESVKITTDQNTKTWYENDRAGHRQSLSILASVTGKKGDTLVVDDANDAEKVQGLANRSAINQRWDNAIYDRVIDFKTGSRVIIAQRTHRDDLIGHALKSGVFEELRIPEEFDSRRRAVTSIGWSDPRTTDGEFLRPDQFGASEKRAAIFRLGSLGYQGKHNQDPQSPEGNLFKAVWLKSWERDPQSPDMIVLLDDRGEFKVNLRGLTLWATADPASSAKTSADFTVISVWAVTTRGDLLWMGCVRKQVDIPGQPKLLAEVFQRWPTLKAIGIEAVASNQAMFQFAVQMHLPATRLHPKGLDKLAHAQGAVITAEQGQLWLPSREADPTFPLDAVRSELLTFTGTPADEHDDIVDSLSYSVGMKMRFYTPDEQRADPIGYSNAGGPMPLSAAPSVGVAMGRRR